MPPVISGVVSVSSSGSSPGRNSREDEILDCLSGGVGHRGSVRMVGCDDLLSGGLASAEYRLIRAERFVQAVSDQFVAERIRMVIPFGESNGRHVMAFVHIFQVDDEESGGLRKAYRGGCFLLPGPFANLRQKDPDRLDSLLARLTRQGSRIPLSVSRSPYGARCFSCRCLVHLGLHARSCHDRAQSRIRDADLLANDFRHVCRRPANFASRGDVEDGVGMHAQRLVEGNELLRRLIAGNPEIEQLEVLESRSRSAPGSIGLPPAPRTSHHRRRPSPSPTTGQARRRETCLRAAVSA